MALPTPTTNATAGLAARAAALRFEDIPSCVLTVAKQCILDVVGAAIAGSTEPGPRMVRSAFLHEGGTGRSSLLGTPALRMSASTAALINGTAAHALDFDDVLTPMVGHPSAPVFPAVLAVAEERGHSGRRVLEAFVSGVEVEGRVGAAVRPGHYGRGFHATGTVGTFGAAVAVAKLLGADAGAVEMALGIAGAQAAGLKCQFGTMTKPLQAGKAAANGLLAARLAAMGFTSTRDVMVCAQGFAATQADHIDLGVLSSEFGSPWYLLQTLFKMHASCHYTHAVFEAARSLRDRAPAADIEEITLRVHPDLLSVCDIPEPGTGLEAKFSMRYVAALALAVGHAGPAQFSDEAVRTPRLRELLARVMVVPAREVPHFTCECVVRTGDGRSYGATRNSEQPAWRHTPDEQTAPLLEKFVTLAGPTFGERRTARLADAIMHLEDIADIAVLLAADADQA